MVRIPNRCDPFSRISEPMEVLGSLPQRTRHPPVFVSCDYRAVASLVSKYLPITYIELLGFSEEIKKAVFKVICTRLLF